VSRRLLLALSSAALVALSACSSTPAAPALTDPKEILTKAAENVQAAKSVHFKADISGNLALDLTGSGSGGRLDLAGTTVDGDIDIAGGNAKASISAPALFNLTGDAIVVGTDTYLRLSLLGDKYQKSSNATGDTLGAISDPKKTIADLQKSLDSLPTPPVKQPDEKCGDKDCYRITIAVPNTNVGGALGGALGGGSAAPSVSGSGTADIWVTKDDLKPAKLAISADGGGQGKLTVTLELTDWDAPVSIGAPPADQVAAPSASPSS
jgi:hypothetical protein